MRDYALGTTFDLKFTTRSFSTGVPTTLAGSPVISAYPDNSTTQITAGITLSVDFDTVTGLNNVRVVATSGNGYASGSNYALVITTGTVGGVSVVGEVVGEFSLEAQSPLRPTTAGRTLDVSSGGESGLDWANVGSPTTTVDLSGTTIKTTQKVDVDTIKTNPVVNGGTITFPTNATVASTTNITGATGIDVTKWNGSAVSVPTNAGVPNVNVKTWNDLATVALPLVPTTAGRTLDVSATGEAGVDWANVGGATTTVDLSGTSIGAVDTGGIAAASFAAGAIDASAIAANAIGASELASDVITDIWQGTAITEAYAADGANATPAQLLYMIWAALAEFAISGVTITAKKLDGVTTAMTFTMDDGTNPTSRTRAS